MSKKRPAYFVLLTLRCILVCLPATASWCSKLLPIFHYVKTKQSALLTAWLLGVTLHPNAGNQKFYALQEYSLVYSLFSLHTLSDGLTIVYVQLSFVSWLFLSNFLCVSIAQIVALLSLFGQYPSLSHHKTEKKKEMSGPEMIFSQLLSWRRLPIQLESGLSTSNHLSASKWCLKSKSLPV